MKTYYDEDDDPTKYWDLRYQEWDKNPNLNTLVSKDQWAEDRFAHILGKPVIQGNSVLDYGCGNTMYAPFLMRRFTKYFGVETSFTALDIAKKYIGDKIPEDDKWRYNAWLIERGAKLPFEDNMFDLVFSITVLQHQPVPERKRIIQELKRVLKPDGQYVGLEMMGQTRAFDMPPMPEEEWEHEWLPFVILKDNPPEHPDWIYDNVWSTIGHK